MANHLKAKGKLAGDRVVATVMSNIGLEVALAERGITLLRAPVGDKYVLEALLAHGGTLGGEQSGHVIFPEISLAGDGMITALEVLKVMKSSGQTLSQLRDGFKTFPQVMVNVRVSSKPPFETIPPIQEAISAVERQFGKAGRLVVRYSGTENVARVMLEGPDEALIKQHADDLANLIRQHIG
jgi:phosphoglucosamine mutase